VDCRGQATGGETTGRLTIKRAVKVLKHQHDPDPIRRQDRQNRAKVIVPNSAQRATRTGNVGNDKAGFLYAQYRR
jgi:hypothetical protein